MNRISVSVSGDILDPAEGAIDSIHLAVEGGQAACTKTAVDFVNDHKSKYNLTPRVEADSNATSAAVLSALSSALT